MRTGAQRTTLALPALSPRSVTDDHAPRRTCGTLPETTTEPVETAAPEAPAPTAPSDDPETVRALARDTLAWCRDRTPATPRRCPRLNTVLELVHDPALSEDVLAAGSAVTRAVIADASPAPAAHAHMTVLMALLLEYEPTRDGVDALFVEWLRHPRSYGPAHATPATFQRDTFVQRLGDLLGWGTLDVKSDRDALTRFAQWVDTWAPKNKFRAKRALDAVRRNFPAADVWNVIRFPRRRRPSSRGRAGPRAAGPGPRSRSGSRRLTPRRPRSRPTRRASPRAPLPPERSRRAERCPRRGRSARTGRR